MIFRVMACPPPKSDSQPPPPDNTFGDGKKEGGEGGKDIVKVALAAGVFCYLQECRRAEMYEMDAERKIRRL